MPKPRHHKKIPQSKKRQVIPVVPPPVQPTSAQQSKPAVPTKAVSVGGSSAASIAPNPYITTELKAIGIVAGILIVILVVLFIVLG